MNLTLVALAVAGLVCLVKSNEISIQDVKVITKDGTFEEVKKQELDHGKVIRSETIRINKPREEVQKRVLAESAPRNAEAEKRRRLFSQFMRHLRMARLLHSILSSYPSESSVGEPIRPLHHLHRVYVIRIPLESLIAPLSLRNRNVIRVPLSLPAQPSPAEQTSSMEIPPVAEKTSLPEQTSPADQASSTDQTSSEAPDNFTSTPVQDQIPSPEITDNSIDNEIPTD